MAIDEATIAKKILDRRKFLQATGTAGLGAMAATTLLSGSVPAFAREDGNNQLKDPVTGDTPAQIFTAALIAEDLATTFYYNGLIGGVIQDPALAGPGGTATNVSPGGNEGNVKYLRAALDEEISHADLLRTLLGIKSSAGDPVQTFYFPAGTFDTLAPFTSLLDALENAFIGAYLNAVREFARMAARAADREEDKSKYNSGQLAYFSEVSASIMGIEAEHRVLGRVISGTDPANNLLFEQTGGLTSVYNGPKSAVVALTPFLTPSTGPGYSFATARANAASVSLPATGGLPPQ